MKKLTAILLLITMVLAMVACGNSSGKNKTTATTPLPTEPETYWEVVQMKDEFGDPQGPYYLKGVFQGTFSNSATSDSNLTVVVYKNGKQTTDQYETNYVFEFYEYGTLQTTFYSSDNVRMKVKSSGSVFEHQFYISNPVKELTTLSKDYDFTNMILAPLSLGKEVSCVVKAGSSTYNFTIMPEGFMEMLEQANRLN